MATRLGPLTPTLHALVTWWFRELRGLVPSRWQQLFSNRVERLEVAFGPRAATFRWLRKRGCVDLGTVDVEGGAAADREQAVRRILDTARKAPRQVDVVLPADWIMTTSLEFPAAAEADLHQLLAFEMDRLTPFKADEVYFDHRIIARDRATRRLRIELCVVPRAVVDRTMATVRDWGLGIDRVMGAATPDERSPWVIIGAAGGRRLGRVQAGATVALAALAAVLLGAVVYLPLQQKRATVEALNAMVADARAVAVEAGELQNRINRMRSQQQFLVERKRRTYPFVAVLNEITEIFPDDTWLFRLQYREGEVQAYGYSQGASALIGLIGESAMFRDPSFRAPVMRDAAAEAERFHLTFQVPTADGEERAGL